MRSDMVGMERIGLSPGIHALCYQYRRTTVSARIWFPPGTTRWHAGDTACRSRTPAPDRIDCPGRAESWRTGALVPMDNTLVPHYRVMSEGTFPELNTKLSGSSLNPMPDHANTELPVRHGSHYTVSSFFLPDGIHSPDAILTRAGAFATNLLCSRGQQQFRAATHDAIEELSRVIRLRPKLYIVIYGTGRTQFAAKLLAAGRLTREIKLVLCEKELHCDILSVTRAALYQVDTDRYPFTGRM